MVTLKVDRASQKRLQQFIDKDIPGGLNFTIRRTLKDSIGIFKSQFNQHTPIGVHSKLKNSFRYSLIKGAGVSEMRISNPTSYWSYVEYGTKPHLPPVDALRPWSELRGIDPWALARSIEKKGTKANPFINRVFFKSRQKILRALNKNIDSTIKTLG